jgi:hypothetical protein
MDKTQELENEIVDYIMDNWGSNETEVKINYLRLLVTKYYENGRKWVIQKKIKH